MAPWPFRCHHIDTHAPHHACVFAHQVVPPSSPPNKFTAACPQQPNTALAAASTTHLVCSSTRPVRAAAAGNARSSLRCCCCCAVAAHGRALLRGGGEKVLLQVRQLLGRDVVHHVVLARRLLARLHLGLLDRLLQVLLTLRLTVKHGVDGALLVQRHLAQPAAQLQDGHRAVGRADRHGGAALVRRKRGERVVRHLHRERGLVVLVVQVPHIQRAVHLDGEEHAGAGGRPRASGEVGGVVLGGEDGRLDRRVVGPHARGPVADGQEVLGVEGVAAQAVDGPMVPVEHVLDAVRGVLSLAVAGENGALLRADHEVGGARVGVVLEHHAAQRRLRPLLLERHGLQLLAQLAQVPPQHRAICRHRHGLRAGLGLQPRQVVHGVPVRDVDGRAVHRRVALAHVVERELAVVLARAHQVGVLEVELGAGDLAGGAHLKLGRVGVVHVPHVAAERHVHGLLLELEDGVGHGDLGDGAVWVPVDVGR
mmetsp:Transcript_38147/g.96525  ORF Transcript_38147/g.96525 Transcript_38147/m.96525 type:complete len:481 (+) Transcript_38147:85-1527(+)